MGPTASVLLRTALSTEQIAELEGYLRSITTQLEGRQGNWWPLWIHDGNLIGLSNEECRASCAFGIALEKYKVEQDFTNEDGTVDEDIRTELQQERDQFLQILGYVPQQSISVYAGCKGIIDHKILGQLVLLLAERYNSIIDLNGALTPPLKVGQHWDSFVVDDVEQYVHSLALPGQVFHVYYMVGGRKWLWHLINVPFLQAWLQHPHFHMIK